MNNANGGNVIYKFLGDTSNLDKAMGKTNGVLKGLSAATGVMAAGVVAASATATAALIGITKSSVKHMLKWNNLQVELKRYLMKWTI